MHPCSNWQVVACGRSGITDLRPSLYRHLSLNIHQSNYALYCQVNKFNSLLSDSLWYCNGQRQLALIYGLQALHKNSQYFTYHEAILSQWRTQPTMPLLPIKIQDKNVSATGTVWRRQLADSASGPRTNHFNPYHSNISKVHHALITSSLSIFVSQSPHLLPTALF